MKSRFKIIVFALLSGIILSITVSGFNSSDKQLDKNGLFSISIANADSNNGEEDDCSHNNTTTSDDIKSSTTHSCGCTVVEYSGSTTTCDDCDAVISTTSGSWTVVTYCDDHNKN